VVAAIEALEGVSVQSVSDRTFLMHRGGKLTIEPKVPITTRDDLSMAYTPWRGARQHGHPRRTRPARGR
jgi:malate dehydrogenase (oxaloacetate-decarboxylating)